MSGYNLLIYSVKSNQWRNLDLESNKKCGCFHCKEIFSSTKITEWLKDDNPIDMYGTAVCPKCGIDSVIGESSGYPITTEFLRGMQEHWFGD